MSEQATETITPTIKPNAAERYFRFEVWTIATDDVPARQVSASGEVQAPSLKSARQVALTTGQVRQIQLAEGLHDVEVRGYTREIVKRPLTTAEILAIEADKRLQLEAERDNMRADFERQQADTAAMLKDMQAELASLKKTAGKGRR